MSQYLVPLSSCAPFRRTIAMGALILSGVALSAGIAASTAHLKSVVKYTLYVYRT